MHIDINTINTKEQILEVWSKNKQKVISLINSKVKRESDIDDIIQEVFIKLWTKNEEIKDKEKILPWLYSVTRFTIADYYREKSKNKDSNLAQIDNLEASEELEGKSDESKKLIPIIHSLPVKYKTVLLMSDIFNMSHREIAAQFDLTISCVKTRVVRARKLLGERMKECCAFTHDKYGNIINCEEKQAYRDCLEQNQKKE